MKSECDILIPFFFFKGRDVEAIIPLKFYLEKFFGYTVEICSIFDPFIIHLKNPKMVLMENTIGSKFHVQFAKYAHSCGLPIISLISEGVVAEEQGVEQGTWGHNTKKKIYFDKLMIWNNDQKKLISKHYPILKKKLDVSGAMGFDRYSIYKFQDKKSFLNKYNKNKFKKIVGYAGFVFSCYFNQNNKDLVRKIGQKNINIFKKDQKIIRGWLKTIIKDNPNILFILKQHPGESSNDMDISKKWQKKYDNVLYFENEKAVADLINVSDLWIVYDSTTCLEAWLLKKPTFTLIPSPNYDVRNNFHQGGLVAYSLKNFQKYFDKFKKGKLDVEIKKTQPAAKIILKKMLHEDDGSNFIKTAQKINLFLVSLPIKKNSKSFLWTLYYCLVHFGLILLSKINFLPVLNNSKILNWYNECSQFYILEKKYSLFLKKFIKNKK